MSNLDYTFAEKKHNVKSYYNYQRKKKKKSRTKSAISAFKMFGF